LYERCRFTSVVFGPSYRTLAYFFFLAEQVACLSRFWALDGHLKLSVNKKGPALVLPERGSDVNPMPLLGGFQIFGAIRLLTGARVIGAASPAGAFLSDSINDSLPSSRPGYAAIIVVAGMFAIILFKTLVV